MKSASEVAAEVPLKISIFLMSEKADPYVAKAVLPIIEARDAEWEAKLAERDAEIARLNGTIREQNWQIMQTRKAAGLDDGEKLIEVKDDGSYLCDTAGGTRRLVQAGWLISKELEAEVARQEDELAAAKEECERLKIDGLNATAVLVCGHPVSLLVKSVESDYSYCELCETRDRLRDALEMERALSAEVTRLKASIGSLCESAAARAVEYLELRAIHDELGRRFNSLAMADAEKAERIAELEVSKGKG